MNCFNAVQNVDEITQNIYQSAKPVSSNGNLHHLTFKHKCNTLNGDLSFDITNTQLHFSNGDSVMGFDVSYAEPVDSAKKTFGQSEYSCAQEKPTDRGNGHSDMEMSRKEMDIVIWRCHGRKWT